MAFHAADYDAYVALADPNAAPLWSWKVWQRFLPAIDPLIQAARGNPAVRSTQYLPNRAGVVRFGRLGLEEVGSPEVVSRFSDEPRGVKVVELSEPRGLGTVVDRVRTRKSSP